MELQIILDYLIISIIASISINSLLGNYAKKRKILVDLPDRSRKFHKRPTPLTGGISIFLALLLSAELYLSLNNLKGYVPDFTYHLFLASLPLVLVFLFDDYKELKPILRLFIQILLSLYIVFTTNISITSLGNLFGFGDITLGIFSVPFTIFCVVGVMNAFNMIDGINGLCAGSAMICLLLTGFYSGLIYDSMLVLIIGSMIGFLIFNLRIFGKKRGVFLGDSGSNLIGFLVAWISIYAANNQFYDIEPISLVWFIAIPLLDCIGLIFNRIAKGVSIASPGRDHIHHKLMYRYSPEATLSIIIAVSLITGLFGIYLDNNFTQAVSTYIFIAYALIYYLFAYFIYKTYQK